MEALDIVNEHITASTKALPEKSVKKTAAPVEKVKDDLGLDNVKEAVTTEQVEVMDASVMDLMKELNL